MSTTNSPADQIAPEYKTESDLKELIRLIHVYNYVDLILSLEWAGSETYYMCPTCHCSQLHGHHKTCQLQTFISLLSPQE